MADKAGEDSSLPKQDENEEKEKEQELVSQVNAI